MFVIEVVDVEVVTVADCCESSDGGCDRSELHVECSNDCPEGMIVLEKCLMWIPAEMLCRRMRILR